MEKKLKGGSTTHVTIIQPDGTLKELTNKTEVESAILSNNRAKYRQCKGGSEFLSEPCLRLFGHYGEGPRVIDVLDNDYPLPSTLSASTVDFINTCKRDKIIFLGVAPIRDRFKAFVSSWKARKEKTVSIHHHIGHYKAILKDDNLC